ncbi:hypothetical protein DFP72DRAFT_324410 [Ephemerocybe angulata]|uniref:Uncharacterized protein n=1 Tax=Ephemerocybe angulata TaxID=980116 RepID=A0A8H6II46_9AGAR|nr:hypothetical protein DFP72DRAFT_324410 [Tulosesus angulatus]
MREYRVALLTPEQMSTSSLIAQVPICFDWAPNVVEEEDLPPHPSTPRHITADAGYDTPPENLTYCSGSVARLSSPIPTPSIRPAIPPHFELLVEVMEEFQKDNGEARVGCAELEVCLSRRKPDFHDNIGSNITDRAKKLEKYLEAALEAKILVSDPTSKRFVSLHPNMLLPKTRTIPPPEISKAAPDISAHPAVAPHYEILVSVMQSYLELGQASVKISQLGVQLPKQKPDVYTQAECGNLTHPLLAYIEAATAAGILIRDSAECVSLHLRILWKPSDPTNTPPKQEPPTPSLDLDNPNRPAVAPHFEIILSIMDYYATYYGQPSVTLSYLQNQLLKQRPFVFSPAGITDPKEALLSYIDTAVGADILMRDSELTVILHPRLSHSKDSTMIYPPSVLPPTPPAPPSPTLIAPSVPEGPAVLPHFDVLIAVMEEYRRRGESCVNRAKLGVDLPKKKADVYAKAGYAGSSKPLRNYIDAAIAAGVLVKNSDHLVSLHPRIRCTAASSGPCSSST